MPGLLVFHVFRHLFEKATADSTHLWTATKSETDRLPRRAGFAVILPGAEFVIFSICPGSDIGMRSIVFEIRNQDVVQDSGQLVALTWNRHMACFNCHGSIVC